MNSGRYFDAAAISQHGRWSHDKSATPSLLDVISRLVPLHNSNEWEIVFGANSTQILKTVLLGLLRNSRDEDAGLTLSIDKRLHPVFQQCSKVLQRFNNTTSRILEGGSESAVSTEHPSGLFAGIQLVPVTCWRTGAVLYGPKELYKLRQGCPRCVIIADAAQCFGNIPTTLFPKLFQGSNSDVILACVQKWIGCSHPLGIAWIRSDLLRKRSELADWLALNDLLGHAAGQRKLLRSFPDTFHGKMAQDIARELQNRYPNKATLEQHYDVLEVNTAFLRGEFGRLADCRLLNVADCAATAIIALSGSPPRLRRISQTLLRAGFQHSLLDPGPRKDRQREIILRISSPLSEINSRDKLVLNDVLKPFVSSK